MAVGGAWRGHHGGRGLPLGSPPLKVLHSFRSRDPAPPVGEEPQRGLGVGGVGAVAAECLSGDLDAIRRALRG